MSIYLLVSFLVYSRGAVFNNIGLFMGSESFYELYYIIYYLKKKNIILLKKTMTYSKCA